MWSQTIYGKLIQYADGPIVKGFEHDIIGTSPSGRNTDRFCHPEFFNLGDGGQLNIEYYPWIGLNTNANASKYLAGAIICQPYQSGEEWNLVAGRIRLRGERGEGTESRLYTHISFSSKRVGSDGWGNGIFDFANHIETKPLESSSGNLPPLEIPNFNQDLPREWVDSIVAPMAQNLLAGLPFVSIEPISPEEFLCKVGICLAALPSGVRWQIPFGAGLYYPKETIDKSICFGIWHAALSKSDPPTLEYDPIFEEYRRQLKAIEANVSTIEELAKYTDNVLFEGFDDLFSCAPKKPLVHQMTVGDSASNFWPVPYGAINACLKSLDDRLVADELKRWFNQSTKIVRLENANFNRGQLLREILASLFSKSHRSQTEVFELLLQTQLWENAWADVKRDDQSAQLAAQLVGVESIVPLDISQNIKFVDDILSTESRIRTFSERMAREIRTCPESQLDQWAMLATFAESHEFLRAWNRVEPELVSQLKIMGCILNPSRARDDHFIRHIASQKATDFDFNQLNDAAEELSSEYPDQFCNKLRDRNTVLVRNFLRNHQQHLALMFFESKIAKSSCDTKLFDECVKQLIAMNWNQIERTTLDEILGIFFRNWSALSVGSKQRLQPIIERLYGETASHILFGYKPKSFQVEIHPTQRFEQFLVRQLSDATIAKRAIADSLIASDSEGKLRAVLLRSSARVERRSNALEFLHNVIARRPVSLTDLPSDYFIEQFKPLFSENGLRVGFSNVVSNSRELYNHCFLSYHFPNSTSSLSWSEHQNTLFRDAFIDRCRYLESSAQLTPKLRRSKIFRLLFPKPSGVEFAPDAYTETEVRLLNALSKYDPKILFSILSNGWPVPNDWIQMDQGEEKLSKLLHGVLNSVQPNEAESFVVGLARCAVESDTPMFGTNILAHALLRYPEIFAVDIVNKPKERLSAIIKWLNPFSQQERSTATEKKRTRRGNKNVVKSLKDLIELIYGRINWRNYHEVINSVKAIRNPSPNVKSRSSEKRPRTHGNRPKTM